MRKISVGSTVITVPIAERAHTQYLYSCRANTQYLHYFRANTEILIILDNSSIKNY